MKKVFIISISIIGIFEKVVKIHSIGSTHKLIIQDHFNRKNVASNLTQYILVQEETKTKQRYFCPSTKATLTSKTVCTKKHFQSMSSGDTQNY